MYIFCILSNVLGPPLGRSSFPHLKDIFFLFPSLGAWLVTEVLFHSCLQIKVIFELDDH